MAKIEYGYVPFDWVKIVLIGKSKKAIIKKYGLDKPGARQKLRHRKSRNPNNPKRIPFIRESFSDLDFDFYPDSKESLLVMHGSLHKVYNELFEEVELFRLDMFLDTLKLLSEEFSIFPSDMHLNQFEFGVNLRFHSILANFIVESVIMHNEKEFMYHKDGKGEFQYKYLKRQVYVAKVYAREARLLRWELKIRKHCIFRIRQLLNTQSLQDLINSDFRGLRKELVRVWNETTFVDMLIIHDDIKHYFSPVYWKKLNRNQRWKEKLKLKELHDNMGSNTHNFILNRILSVFEQLDESIETN